ncbi:MAG: hypothetical protein M1831_004977 [Alyxoria varia]|nr:MAG: hypothetical protein M1831_004977 [Alyxoria varia]
MDLLPPLQEHLSAVDDDPGVVLDERQLDTASLILAPALLNSSDPAPRQQLVQQIATLLPKLQQDPTSLITLVKKLIHKSTFKDVLSLEPQVDLVAGLSLNAPQPYNELMIQILRKAAASPAELASLAASPEVVLAFVKCWLSTPEVSVVSQADEAILHLLKSDQEPKSSIASKTGNRGTGLLWRRFFGDKDIYGEMLRLTSRTGDFEKEKVSEKTRSLAQIRLLAFATDLAAMDIDCLAQSHHPEIERNVSLDPDKEGFFDYVFVRMVPLEDEMMIACLLNSCMLLVRGATLPSRHDPYKSRALELLMSRGLHDRISNIFFGKHGFDSVPRLSLSGMSGLTISSQYIASYTSLYPTSFLRQPEDSLLNLPRLLTKLAADFDQAESTWFHSEEANFKLFVMAMLPKVALLPQKFVRLSEPPKGLTPLLMVRCGRNPGPAALHCLAKVFGNTLEGDPDLGNEQLNAEDIWSRNEGRSSDASSTTDTSQPPYYDRVLSYALFATYISYYPDLILNLGGHVDAAASDEAMPALNLLHTIISSTWAPLPPEGDPETQDEDYILYDECEAPASPNMVPSEPQLRDILYSDRILSTSSSFPTISCAREDSSDDRTQTFDYGPAAFTYPILHLYEHPQSRIIFPWLMEPPRALETMVGSGLADPKGTVRRLTEAKWELLKLARDKLSEILSNADCVRNERKSNALQSLLLKMDERLEQGMWRSGGSGEGVGSRVAVMEL